jgi:hypothetical protein
LGADKAAAIIEKYKSFPEFYEKLKSGDLEVSGIGETITKSLQKVFLKQENIAQEK